VQVRLIAGSINPMERRIARAALASYCLEECERRSQLLHGLISAAVLTSIALVAFRFSGDR
jgi:hypothetical protein